MNKQTMKNEYPLILQIFLSVKTVNFSVNSVTPVKTGVNV